MNQIICKIFGGHKYKDTGLEVYQSPKRGYVTFCNRCVRCGSEKEWEVPERAIYGDMMFEQARKEKKI